LDNSRLIELYELINSYDRAYYGFGDSLVSDREYDALYSEMITLEEKNPQNILANSPSKRVGDDLSTGFKKVEHNTPMMSIDNSYSEEEMESWAEKTIDRAETKDISFIAELKMDGIACSLTYEDGKLVRAVTRGNGAVGDDITANVKTIRAIPLTISSEESLEIRGEIFMPFKSFEKLNSRLEADGKTPLQNPRNATAGTIKLHSPKEVSKRELSFIAFFLLNTATESKTHLNNLTTLNNFGFITVDHSDKLSSPKDITKFCNKWDRERFSLPYPVDGIVVKVNERSLYEKIGFTAKAPRWAMAYKYEPEQAEATLLAIDLQIGRTGAITPVARLTPMSLAGTTVQNATLHNFDEIERLNVNVGDTVLVEKSGEIIPKILKVVHKKSETYFSAPTNCPSCNSELIKKADEVVLRCLNSDCPEKIYTGVTHFVSRGAMDISGLGPSIIKQLISEKLIKESIDLYSLKFDDLINLDRMGDKKANNSITSINESKTKGLARFIFAIGIPQVGAQTAKILAKYLGSLTAIMETTKEELEKLDTIGSEIALSITTFFEDEKTVDTMNRFIELGLLLETEKVESEIELPLSGKTFVITGTLLKFKRNDAKELLEKLGAKVSGSVSKNTTALIAGEKAGSKRTKAEALGVEIYDEKFLESL
jgi:DNA ligase (NAD+)